MSPVVAGIKVRPEQEGMLPSKDESTVGEASGAELESV
jgi:hypothetical protein